MTELDAKETHRVRTLLRRWAKLWDATDLPDAVQVAYSPRLRCSLAKCSPSTGTIALNSVVKTLSLARFSEVICHEAAHVAAFRLFGRGVKPHGPEWAQLVRGAGYEPNRRAVAVTSNTQRNTPSLVYEHYCPVCQQAWLARRPVRAWRCGDCFEVGLPGELIIHKRI